MLCFGADDINFSCRYVNDDMNPFEDIAYRKILSIISNMCIYMNIFVSSQLVNDVIIRSQYFNDIIIDSPIVDVAVYSN
jgi:hypothetical protein